MSRRYRNTGSLPPEPLRVRPRPTDTRCATT